MRAGLKILLALLTVVYIVSPVDLMIGPIDDIIVALLGVAAQKTI
jgi:uncharacterized membrane protein YkvA (DUF1232 family)